MNDDVCISTPDVKFTVHSASELCQLIAEMTGLGKLHLLSSRSAGCYLAAFHCRPLASEAPIGCAARTLSTAAGRTANMAAAVGSTESCYVLAHDDEWSHVKTTSEQWLREAPRGAYTTSRTIDSDAVFDLQHHVDRLANSAQLMQQDDCEKGDADALAFQEAAATLLKSEQLRPRIIASLRAATRGFRTVCDQHEMNEELRLTTLLTWGRADVHALTHAALLPDVPRPPIKVQIRGVGRSNAKAKDSEWVRQRAAMQDSKPADVNEILLLDEHDCVLEGMSSNVFVLAGGRVATPGRGILVGTVRNLVIDVCEREGIPVVLQAPPVAEADSWDGMLITSTSRLALPVDRIELPDGRTRTFEASELLERLKARTAEAIRDRSERFI